jgi:transcriptional regulator with XRE-family HTH domain
MISEDTKKEFLQQFGARLAELRKMKDLSYRKLAQNCDLDYSYISKIEKGETNITLETILELMKGLQVQPKDLLDFNFDLEKLNNIKDA